MTWAPHKCNKWTLSTIKDPLTCIKWTLSPCKAYSRCSFNLQVIYYRRLQIRCQLIFLFLHPIRCLQVFLFLHPIRCQLIYLFLHPINPSVNPTWSPHLPLCSRSITTPKTRSPPTP